MNSDEISNGHTDCPSAMEYVLSSHLTLPNEWSSTPLQIEGVPLDVIAQWLGPATKVWIVRPKEEDIVPVHPGICSEDQATRVRDKPNDNKCFWLLPGTASFRFITLRGSFPGVSISTE